MLPTLPQTTPRTLHTLLLLLLCLSITSAVTAQTGPDCTAFSTTGTTASTYQFYRLFDFRDFSNADKNPSYTGTAGNSSAYRAIRDESWLQYWYRRDYPRKVSATSNAIPVYFQPEYVHISTFPLHHLPSPPRVYMCRPVTMYKREIANHVFHVFRIHV